MAAKFSEKKKKKNLLVPVLTAVAILLAAALLCLYFLRPVEQEAAAPSATTSPTAPSAPSEEVAVQPETAQTEPREEVLEHRGLQIVEIRSYTGAYMEDGSDEVLSELLSVVVDNKTGQALQYADLTLSFSGEEEAHFSVSNVPKDGRVVLLEANRMQYTDEVPSSCQVQNMALLPEFELHEDTFRISAMDGVLNVKNISERDISGTISVFYKNKIQDVYYGGITYRAKIENGLKAGEIRQIPTKHFDPDNCEILMVTFTG